MLKLPLFFILFLAIFNENIQGYPPTRKIHQALLKSLEAKSTANVFINLDSTKPILDQLQKQLTHKSRAEKRTIVAEALKRHAATTQSSLVELLRKKSINYQSFWITNQILVRDADIEFIQQLAKRSDVFRVREDASCNKQYSLEHVEISTKAVNPKELEDSLKVIGVQEVHDAGIKGSGVRVAIMDTGVRVTHEALSSTYSGEYGWFDPNSGSDLPFDSSNRGTHSLGTIVGQNGIGIAPEAQWMACQNIPGGEAEAFRCAEHFLCPTLADGTNPDCTKGADLVANSWSNSCVGLGGDDFFDETFDAWATAGIVPVFSTQDYGYRGCSSISSPADSAHPALITVGGTYRDNDWMTVSGLGPSPFGDKIKPDIVAPGAGIRSALSSEDYSYGVLPRSTRNSVNHVAGVVALILDAHPNASIAEIQKRIYDGAVNTTSGFWSDCGGIPEFTYPNNQVGHGRVHAPSAVLG